MSDSEPTIKIRRPPRVRTDDKGRTVWADPIEPDEELELVSTKTLRAILESKDPKPRKAMQAAVSGHSDGVLARDPAAGTFEIISEGDLQTILDNTDDLPTIHRPADVNLVPAHEESGDELSLVSTQALRKILGSEVPNPAKPKKSRDTSGGFDPYNRS
jgi:hypothetical protein